MTKQRALRLRPVPRDPYAKLRFQYDMPAHGADTSTLNFKMSPVGIAVKQLCFGISVGAYSTAKN